MVDIDVRHVTQWLPLLSSLLVQKHTSTVCMYACSLPPCAVFYDQRTTCTHACLLINVSPNQIRLVELFIHS